jgi:hypothetical protein
MEEIMFVSETVGGRGKFGKTRRGPWPLKAYFTGRAHRREDKTLTNAD